ncbi:hypothetical protein N0V85_005283 [Neurospora sp. IMI 360204]|nr:hypothetical protein N0V85_005283 [Neurospora sp. IMI 360204]
MPAKKTRAKKAQAKKKQAKKTQPKEILSPNTPPADGRSPFTKLPLEIHMVIGDMLKENKQLGALAKLARTSRRLCSFYEQQLYKGKGNTHNIDALTGLFGNRPYGDRPNAEGTALQLAIREKQNQSMRWLFNEGVLVDLPDKPVRNMCRCGQGYYARDAWASSLHVAICTGNLEAVKLLLRVRHEAVASLEFSRNFDHVPILHTAVLNAFRGHSLDILDFVLENSIIRQSINGFKSEGSSTTLAMVLFQNNNHHMHVLTEKVLAALVKAGASLGPYPSGSFLAGQSPLMVELDQGNLRTNASYLLRLGCDPNGDRPDPVTPEWVSPLHLYIRPEHQHRNSPPFWQPRSVRWQWQVRERREIRDFIVVLLKHGASLDITNFEQISPLDNAMSYMARYLAPGRRVIGFKFVKLLLANVKDKGISKKSRKRAEDVMAILVQDLRAEHATHDLSDARVSPRPAWGEEESQPIRLGWHTWRREGGRLRRK